MRPGFLCWICTHLLWPLLLHIDFLYMWGEEDGEGGRGGERGWLSHKIRQGSTPCNTSFLNLFFFCNQLADDVSTYVNIQQGGTGVESTASTLRFICGFLTFCSLSSEPSKWDVAIPAIKPILHAECILHFFYKCAHFFKIVCVFTELRKYLVISLK